MDGAVAQDKVFRSDDEIASRSENAFKRCKQLKLTGQARTVSLSAFYCRRSFIATATTTPEAKVSTAMAAIARAAPNRSAIIPAESAPIA